MTWLCRPIVNKATVSFARTWPFARKETVMREWQSLSHVRWYCRYHVVFVPKYRKRAIFGNLRVQIRKDPAGAVRAA